MVPASARGLSALLSEGPGALGNLLIDGPTEEAAKLTQEICKPTRGSMASDIFFQRGLKRDSEGVMVVIRDFHDPVPPAARELANGHDCLIVIGNLLK